MIDANLGFVERVDVVPVPGKNFKRAFVHFAAGKWNMRDSTARAALKALQEGNKIKLEYESPWYWLVGISGAVRPDEAPKPKQRKTRIDLTTTSKPEAKASYDLSAQQDAELAPSKLTRQENPLNDPIVARAMSNSPTAKVSDEQLEQHSHLSEQAATYMAQQVSMARYARKTEESAEDN